MENAALILLALLMVGTVVALVTGLVVMVRGGNANAKYSNKLMQARVLLQALALGVFALVMLYLRTGH